MKKKIVGVAIMVTIAVTAGWNMSQNDNEVKLSDLALDNVEALAAGESSGGGYDQYGYKYVASPRACCSKASSTDRCSSVWPDC